MTSMRRVVVYPDRIAVEAADIPAPARTRPWSALRAALPSALVALDFDGTLAPISPHPDDARPLAGADQILRDVRATGATVAVVTGRTVASLLRVSSFGAVPGIVIYGTHGAERWQAGELRAPAPPPGLDELRLSLPGLLTSIGPDLWIEDKGLSLVIHARLTADPERALQTLRAPVGAAATAAGLRVRPGKEVLKICISRHRQGHGDPRARQRRSGGGLLRGRRPRRPARHPRSERVGRTQRAANIDRGGESPRKRPDRRPGRRHGARSSGSHVTAAADPPKPADSAAVAKG